ncbi:hypothetical protein [Pedobacter sp. B4-66]|uniref:hypothetical protein n=1 Tax=Pedobacter sp. B4-66 TaxID=2817280 RepID=UPI001BD9431D|nr:hypothetical protein [Pedobacter sp. B4-66]
MGKNKKTQSERDNVRNGLAERIALIILKVQGKWAIGMRNITSGLSTRSMKVYVILITLTMTGYAGLLVYSALNEADSPLLRIGSIHKPLIQTYKTEDENIKDTLMLLRLRKFHTYLDSLGMSASGRKTRDSLLKQRPGLLDSLNQLEALLK